MTMQSKPKHLILKNTLILFVGQIITLVLSIITAVYVPRYLGPQGTGEIALAGALTSLISTIGALGIGTLMTRDIARDHAKAPDLIGAAIMIRAILSLPSLLFIALIAWVAGYSTHTQVVIYINAVAMIFGFLGGPLQAGFQAFERMKYNTLGGIISECIITFGSIAVVLAGHGVILLSVISTGASLVSLMFFVFWWKPLSSVHLRPNFRLMRYLVVSGLPFWITGIFLTIYVYIDSLMLSFLTSTEVVGWYNVPVGLFGLLLFLPTAVSTAIFPALARTYKTAPREMAKMARRSFNLLACLSLPIAVGGILLAKQFILMVYGLSFGESIPVMMVLAATVVPTYLNILINQFLVATERQIIWTKVMAAACVINPLINVVLINYYQQAYGNGAYGAAWALLLTEGLMTIVGIVILPRRVLGWSNVVSMAKSCSAAGLMALGVWYTQGYFIAIPVAVGMVIYVVAALALGALPREDLQLLEPLVAKALRKVGKKRRRPQTEQTDMKAA
ncbi:MAG TPA: flippase [Ktedonobacterales bacterium]